MYGLLMGKPEGKKTKETKKEDQDVEIKVLGSLGAQTP
jgi:hypothetical protein